MVVTEYAECPTFVLHGDDRSAEGALARYVDLLRARRSSLPEGSEDRARLDAQVGMAHEARCDFKAHLDHLADGALADEPVHLDSQRHEPRDPRHAAGGRFGLRLG